MIKNLLLKLIRAYQRVFSPDHGLPSRFYPGGFCKYSPSCSEYCAQSIDRFGVLKGMAKGIWRILRCNPWSKGGSDPV